MGTTARHSQLCLCRGRVAADRVVSLYHLRADSSRHLRTGRGDRSVGLVAPGFMACESFVGVRPQFTVMAAVEPGARIFLQYSLDLIAEEQLVRAALRHVDKAARHAIFPDDRLVPAGATLVAVAMAGPDARGGKRRKAKFAPRGYRGRIVYHFRRRSLALLVLRLQARHHERLHHVYECRIYRLIYSYDKVTRGTGNTGTVLVSSSTCS